MGPVPASGWQLAELGWASLAELEWASLAEGHKQRARQTPSQRVQRIRHDEAGFAD